MSDNFLKKWASPNESKAIPNWGTDPETSFSRLAIAIKLSATPTKKEIKLKRTIGSE